MSNIDKKHYCNYCNYGTSRLSSYKLHLTRKYHIKNTRHDSSIKMVMSKYKKDSNNIDIVLIPKEKEVENESIKFLESVSDELLKLKEENMLLKINMQDKYSTDDINETFSSIFDDDFSLLFSY